jgi:hypothetical protein
MSKLVNLAVAGAALLASATTVAAQEREVSSNMQSGLSSYALAPLPSGRYVAPKAKKPPRQAVRPFTWEEKRHFDVSDGEEG